MDLDPIWGTLYTSISVCGVWFGLGHGELGIAGRSWPDRARYRCRNRIESMPDSEIAHLTDISHRATANVLMPSGPQMSAIFFLGASFDLPRVHASCARPSMPSTIPSCACEFRLPSPWREPAALPITLCLIPFTPCALLFPVRAPDPPSGKCSPAVREMHQYMLDLRGARTPARPASSCSLTLASLDFALLISRPVREMPFHEIRDIVAHNGEISRLAVVDPHLFPLPCRPFSPSQPSSPE